MSAPKLIAATALALIAIGTPLAQAAPSDAAHSPSAAKSIIAI